MMRKSVTSERRVDVAKRIDDVSKSDAGSEDDKPADRAPMRAGQRGQQHERRKTDQEFFEARPRARPAW